VPTSLHWEKLDWPMTCMSFITFKCHAFGPSMVGEKKKLRASCCTIYC
jgi:hypothetical protein